MNSETLNTLKPQNLRVQLSELGINPCPEISPLVPIGYKLQHYSHCSTPINIIIGQKLITYGYGTIKAGNIRNTSRFCYMQKFTIYILHIHVQLTFTEYIYIICVPCIKCTKYMLIYIE